MSRRLFKEMRGIAALEIAVASMMLFTLLLGAFGMVFVLHKFMAVQAAVDKYAYDGAIKAIGLSTSGGRISLVVNDAIIRHWLAEAAQRLEAELQAELDSPQSGFWLESSYAVLEFDSATGRSLGVAELPFRAHSTRGGMSLPANLLERSDPGMEYSRLAGLTQGQGAEALLALPSGLHWQENQPSSIRYQDKVVAIHIRAFVSFSDGLTGQIYSWLGGEPVAWSAKAVVLRKEL